MDGIVIGEVGANVYQYGLRWHGIAVGDVWQTHMQAKALMLCLILAYEFIVRPIIKRVADWILVRAFRRDLNAHRPV
jgi:hypothetical protein